MIATSRFCAALALTVVAAPLLAAPVDAVNARINGLRELGAAFKNVNDALRESELQTILIQQSARTITNAARAQGQWFPAGSGPNPAWKTAAMPEIWTQAAQFRAAQATFSRAADAFQRAAASGNADAIRASTRGLGAACKGCHDQFKNKEKA